MRVFRREAYPIFEEAAKEAVWDTKHVDTDESLYGIDEILAFSIVNLYGSIGFTNYGYLDKVKPGIIKKLDSKEGGHCNTFLDDLVGAVAAAAAGKLAHNEPHRVRHALAEKKE